MGPHRPRRAFVRTFCSESTPHNIAMRSLSLLAALAAVGPTLAAKNCPPLGPIFEPPRNFNANKAIQAVIANLTETLKARDLDNSPTVRANETSYSIEVFS